MIFLRMTFIMLFQKTVLLIKYYIKLKDSKKKIKVKFVYSKIMNQLSYHVDKSKLNKEGLYLKNKIINDIDDTMKLLKNI